MTPTLPPRDTRGHKGTFGTVCVVGGQAAAPTIMIGGPALSAVAALRAGAGLAVLAVPAPILPAAITIAPSATGLALPVDSDSALDGATTVALIESMLPEYACVAIGPGFGRGTGQSAVLTRLMTGPTPPLVIDADAINVLAEIGAPVAAKTGDVVITPHPGEFRRLAAALGIDADPVDPVRRPDAARALARRLGVVVVLKGAGTVVSDGERSVVNETGNAALATAGTGDVLTGMVAGLVAQFARRGDGESGLSLFDCARLAVQFHGRAADRWAARHGAAGLLAADLLDELPSVLAEARA